MANSKLIGGTIAVGGPITATTAFYGEDPGGTTPYSYTAAQLTTWSQAAVAALSGNAAGTILQGQAAAATPVFTATPTLGVASSVKGTLSFCGNTSGTVTIQPAAAAGTWSLTLPTTGGTSGYALTTNGSGVTTWTAITALTNFSSDGTTLSGSGQTVTTSAPILSLTQTWNAGGVTFTGILVNVTSTASAAASLLMDLQVAGGSQFSVNKSGVIKVGAGAAGSPSMTFTADAASGFYQRSGTRITVSIAGATNRAEFQQTALLLASTYTLCWGSGDASSASDTSINRSAAGVISIGTGDPGNSDGSILVKSKAGAFANTDLAAGTWLVGRDTSGATTKLYYNNAGTLMAVALA